MKKRRLLFLGMILSASCALGQSIAPISVPESPDYKWNNVDNSGNNPVFDNSSNWTPATAPFSYANKKYQSNTTDKSYLIGSGDAYSFTGLVLDKSNDLYVTNKFTITTTSDHDSGTAVSGGASLNVVGGSMVLTRANTTGSANLFVGSGSQGSLAIQDGTFSQPITGSICVGYGNNGIGTMSVSGDSTVNINTYLIAGDNGATSNGTIDISGGTVSTTGSGGIYVGHVGTGALNLSGGTLTSGNGLYVGNKGTGRGTLIQTGGTINVKAGSLQVGLEQNAVGEYTFTNGSLVVSNVDIGGKGTGLMNMSGGKVNITRVNIGLQGTGTGIQSGGDIVYTDYFCVGNNLSGSGNYTMTGGTIKGNWMVFGHANNASGTFTQSGGSIDLTNRLVLGNDTNTTSGTYNLSGGSMKTAGTIEIANKGQGTLNMTGGTMTITSSQVFSVGNQAGSVGVINMSGGTISVNERINIGNGGSGTLNLSGDGYITLLGNDKAFVIGSGTNSTGTVRVTGGTIKVPNVCVGWSGTGSLELSDGKIECTNWYLPAFSAGTGKTIQTGGVLTTPWFITAWDNKAGNGTHEMYGGTLTVGNGQGTSHNGRAGTGYINMYGGTASFVNLEAGQQGGTGIFNFSGGDMTLSGNLVLTNAESKINFIGGAKGFGSLAVGGNLSDGAKVNVSLGNGIAFLEDYNPAKGIELMTVGGTGTPAVTADSGLTTDWNNKTLTVKIDQALYKGSLSATSGTLDANSSQGWVDFKDIYGSDPYEMTIEVSNVADMDSFLEALNKDLKVGEQQVYTARASEGNKVIIEGLSSYANGEVFYWNFGPAAYGDAVLGAVHSQQVPEPSSVALLILGAAGLFWIRKRVAARK